MKDLCLVKAIMMKVKFVVVGDDDSVMMTKSESEMYNVVDLTRE